MTRSFRYPSGLFVVPPNSDDMAAFAPDVLARHEAAASLGLGPGPALSPTGELHRRQRGALDALQWRPPHPLLSTSSAANEDCECETALRSSGAAVRVRRSASKRRNEALSSGVSVQPVPDAAWPPPGALSMPSLASGSGSGSASASLSLSAASCESEPRSPVRDRDASERSILAADRRAMPLRPRAGAGAGDPLGALESLCSQIYPMSAEMLQQRERQLEHFQLQLLQQQQLKASLSSPFPPPPPLRPACTAHDSDSNSNSNSNSAAEKTAMAMASAPPQSHAQTQPEVMRWWQAIVAEQSRHLFHSHSQQCALTPSPRAPAPLQSPPAPAPAPPPPPVPTSSELSSAAYAAATGLGAGLLSGLRASLPHLHSGCNAPACAQCARERFQFYAMLYQYSQSLSQLARPAAPAQPAAFQPPEQPPPPQQPAAGANSPQSAAAALSNLHSFYTLFPALASAMPSLSMSLAGATSANANATATATASANAFPVPHPLALPVPAAADKAEPPASKRPHLQCPQPQVPQSQSQSLPNPLLQAYMFAHLQQQQLASAHKLASPATPTPTLMPPQYNPQVPFPLLSPNLSGGSKSFGAAVNQLHLNLNAAAGVGNGNAQSPPPKPAAEQRANASPNGGLAVAPPPMFPGELEAGSEAQSQHVCNWLQGGVFCGQRFESAESLWRHLRAHVDVSSASPPLPSPDHLLASCGGASASGPDSLPESDALAMQTASGPGHISSRRHAHHARRRHNEWPADDSPSLPGGRRTRAQRSGRQLELSNC